MSFKCTLQIEDQTFPVLQFLYHEKQQKDASNRPVSVPVHDGFEAMLELSQTSLGLFWAWMVSPDMLKDGSFHWERRDGQGTYYLLEFWDAYCVDFRLNADFTSREPATVTVRLSPQRHSNQGVPFIRQWPGFPSSVSGDKGTPTRYNGDPSVVADQVQAAVAEAVAQPATMPATPRIRPSLEQLPLNYGRAQLEALIAKTLQPGMSQAAALTKVTGAIAEFLCTPLKTNKYGEHIYPIKGDKVRGPVLAGVMDTETGNLFLGINHTTGLPPENLHPLLKGRLRERENEIKFHPEKAYDYTKGPGSHAEIYALDQAIKAREKHTGVSVTEADLDSFLLYNRDLAKKSNGKLDKEPCPDCMPIVNGVTYMDSFQKIK